MCLLCMSSPIMHLILIMCVPHYGKYKMVITGFFLKDHLGTWFSLSHMYPKPVQAFPFL